MTTIIHIQINEYQIIQQIKTELETSYSKFILQVNQREYIMEAIVQVTVNPGHDNQNNGHALDSDLEAEDLFNQIQLDPPHRNGDINNDQQNQQNMLEDQNAVQNEAKSLKKFKKIKKLQLDSENQIDDNNGQQKIKNKHKKHKEGKKSKKQRKRQKKQRKKLKKQKKQRKHGSLKKLRKQGDQQKQNSQNQQWSGQSSQQSAQQSDISSDSLLQKLNPKKLKNKSNHKQKSAQKKQGFSLNQLGNDAEVDYKNLQVSDNDEDESYGKNNKKNKKKAQKKQVQKNQNMLQQLLHIGACQQQQSYENNKQGYQYDNGFQQVQNMKNTKKKGPQIKNKLFSNMQIKGQQENNAQALPTAMDLEFKPRVSSGPSSITSSFLNKAQKIKKSRGMQSQMQNQQYQRMMTSKTKQSMARLISQKQIQQADEIYLDVQVPQVVKGRTQINNSIFIKRVASENLGNKGDPNSASAKKKKQVDLPQNNIKISRLDLFKSISQQVKSRKSKDVTQEAVKNSFKVTQLEQIEEMRKKNEEKKRRQALQGSDQQQDDEDYEINKEQAKQMSPQEQIKQHNFHFLNFKVQVPNAQKQGKKEQNGNLAIQADFQPQNNQRVVNGIIQQVSQQNQQTNKSKRFRIQLQSAIPEKQYIKLLSLQQGQGQGQGQVQQGDEQLNQLLQLEDNESQLNQKKELDLDNMQLQYAGEHQQQQQSQLQQMNDGQKLKAKDISINISNARQVQLQVDLQVSNENQDDMSEEQQDDDEEMQEEQPVNEEYRKYLNELEEEGIQIRKNVKRNADSYNNPNLIAARQGQPGQDKQMSSLSQQKQNNQKIQNSQQNSQPNINSTSNSNRNPNKSTISQYLNNSYEQARLQFKKLRKLATILKTKKKFQIRNRKAGQFYEQQAEQGSDNEQHDGQMKLINDDDEAKLYEGIDLDADLEELIDNAVDIDEENQQLAFRKYMQDVKIKDREELMKVIHRDFRKRDDNEIIMQEMEEDEKERIKRIEQFQEYIRKRELEDDKHLYMNEEEQKSGSDQDDQDDDGEDKQVQEENVQKIQQQVQQMNQQNLKRYLDDCLLDSYRPTKIITVTRPITQLPESYQRTKKNQMRNTMKSKQTGQDSIKMLKLKKTSSHLNQIIMKNKEKVKPLPIMKGIPLLSLGKK